MESAASSSSSGYASSGMAAEGQSQSALDTEGASVGQQPGSSGWRAEDPFYDDPLQEVPGAGQVFVSALAAVVSHLAALTTHPTRVTRFHAIRAPNLSIHDYLRRIAKYFQCSNECFVLCLVYIDRIVKRHPEFTICNLNIHRLLVTSIMLAVKFFDDVYYSNAYYAKVGGVKTKEVNALEAQFLHLIDWCLHVTPQEYDQYRNQVFSAVSGGGAVGDAQPSPWTMAPSSAPPAAAAGSADLASIPEESGRASKMETDDTQEKADQAMEEG